MTSKDKIKFLERYKEVAKKVFEGDVFKLLPEARALIKKARVCLRYADTTPGWEIFSTLKKTWRRMK